MVERTSPICGLVGAFGDVTFKEEEVFQDLLTIDIIRGPHSTGVAAVNNQNRLLIAKSLQTPPYFFDEAKYKEIGARFNCLLLGHNRFATKGAVTKSNAHPFLFDPIVGAHNGTILDQWRLPDHTDFDTDSENIFYSICMQGIDDTWKLMNGAAALVWYDLQEKQLNMVRNAQRPLYWRFTKDFKVLFWASEPWMIQGAALRNKVTLDDQIYFPKADEHYIFEDHKKGVTLVEGRKLTPFRHGTHAGVASSKWPPAGGNKLKKLNEAARAKGTAPVDRKPGDEWIDEGKKWKVNAKGHLVYSGKASTEELVAEALKTDERLRQEEHAAVTRARARVAEGTNGVEVLDREGNVLPGRGSGPPSVPLLPAPGSMKNGSTVSIQQIPKETTQIQEMTTDLDNVKFLQEVALDAQATNDRRKAKAAKKVTKNIRKKRALARRQGRKKKTGGHHALTEKENQDLEFYDKFGYFCMNDPSHPLDPHTAMTVTGDRAICEECMEYVTQMGMSPFGLKGA